MIKNKKTNGFTVVELIMVSAILVTVFFTAITSFPFIRDQFEFEANLNTITGILLDGKTYAMSNKVYEDKTDYDGDGDTTDNILPNGYIVYFNLNGLQPPYMALYADVYSSANLGQLDKDACGASCDQLIREVELEENIDIIVEQYDHLFTSKGPVTEFSVFYSTPEGEFTLIGQNKYTLEFEVQDIKNDDIVRDRFIFVHYFQGIPEKSYESLAI